MARAVDRNLPRRSWRAGTNTGRIRCKLTTFNGFWPQALRSHLYFEGKVAGTPAAEELEARLDDDPADSEARFQLALRKVVERDYDAAMELLLQLMQKDRGYGEDAGRLGLLKVFELLGDDPRVGQYRRRMASLLH